MTAVVHGNALAVLASLPDEHADAVVTDPPYSSGGMTRGDRTAPTGGKYIRAEDAGVDFAGDSRDQRAYGYWSALWLAEALRVTRAGGTCLLFTDWRQLPTTTDALQAGGWVWRGIVAWVKSLGTARPMAGRFAAQCEYVVWGSRGPMPVDMTPGLGTCLPGFLHGDAPRGDDREHQTQKPLNVMRQLVRIAPPGGLVLDPFAGSGTTGVAAVIEGRRFLGVEQVEHYARLADERIRHAALQATPRLAQDALDLAGATS